MREILLGILASLFFAVTFILNRSMEVSGGAGFGALLFVTFLWSHFYSSLFSLEMDYQLWLRSLKLLH